MARPIPINQGGLRHERRFESATFPTWNAPQHAPARAVDSAPEHNWLAAERVLFLISGVVGGVAIVLALDLWPALGASNLGLDKRGAFYLLASGIYLLATIFYSIGRTRWLCDLNQASWDVRLMIYTNIGIGVLVILVLGTVVLAALAIVLALIGIGSLLLSGLGGQSRE